MKNIFLISLMFISPTLLAQGTFIKDITKVNHAIGKKAVDDHVKSKGKIPLAGEHIAAIMPTVEVDPTNTCAEEVEADAPAKGTHYEVIFVAQGNSQASSTVVKGQTVSGPNTALAQSMVSYAASNPKLSEGSLAKNMAKMISDKYKTDEEKFDALAAFSDRLNQNYNKSRNPGFNTPKNNPTGAVLPGGDLTLGQISTAAFKNRVFDGGVCNDISEAVAMVGEQLFPDKDVLVINSGSHHGVVVSDGKTNRVINYAKQASQVGKLVLDDKFTATNMRVSKMDGGNLKQIAVVDTQTGQMMEQAFQTGKPLLKTNTDISSFVSHFNIVNEGEKRKHQLSIGAGMGDLDSSKMYVVVAKYEYTTDRWRNYIGVGGSGINPDVEGPMKYQLHLRMGTEFGLIRYATPKLTVNMTTGLHAEGMYGFKAPVPEGGQEGSWVDASGGVEVVNRLGVAYRPSPRTTLSADVELRHAFGPRSWGTATGVWSGGTGAGITGTLGNMGLHLNQVNASAAVEHKFSPNVTGFVEGKYQGSNIGSSLGVLGGLQIAAPKGATILVFTGYSTTKLPGYETQHSLLVGPNGALFGAGYQTASGIAFTGSVSGIQTELPPIVQGGISIPLGAPAPKRKPSSGPPSF